MAEHTFVSIPGSERRPVRGAKRVGPARGDERIEVTVRVRRKAPLPAAALDGRASPAKRTYLAHSQLEVADVADPADLAKVETFARQAGLIVVEASASRRSVVLSGTVAAFSKAFNVVLERWEHPGGTYRGRAGPVQIPSDLAGIVTGVFGLDNRPFARPHFRRLTPGTSPPAFNGYTPQIGYNAGPGWNACTGLGSPDGLKLLAVLGGP